MYLQTHGVRLGQDSAKKAISFIEVMFFNLFHLILLSVDCLCDIICFGASYTLFLWSKT